MFKGFLDFINKKSRKTQSKANNILDQSRLVRENIHVDLLQEKPDNNLIHKDIISKNRAAFAALKSSSRIAGNLFVPERDAWEADDSDFDKFRHDLQKEFLIHYRDKDGIESRRRIRTRYFFKRDSLSLSIFAYCYQRNANRTFVSSRMIGLIDFETGEIISDPYQYFLRTYDESPRGRLKFVEVVRASELCVLVFVARSDGQLRKKQKDPILAFLRSAHFAELADVDDEDISYVVSCVDANQQDYRRALKELKVQSKTEKDKILEVMSQISATRNKNREITDAAVKIALKNLS